MEEVHVAAWTSLTMSIDHADLELGRIDGSIPCVRRLCRFQGSHPSIQLAQTRAEGVRSRFQCRPIGRESLIGALAIEERVVRLRIGISRLVSEDLA
jgi:hypothetical protein